jgi:hypothetical protein
MNPKEKEKKKKKKKKKRKRTFLKKKHLGFFCFLKQFDWSIGPPKKNKIGDGFWG